MMKPTNFKALAGVLTTGLMLAATWAQAQFAPGFGGFNGNSSGSTSSRSSSRSATTYPTSTDVGQARITYDNETRSLIIVADEETAMNITNMVHQLDRPAPQVLIKCVFLEITYNKGSDIGVSGIYTKTFSAGGSDVLFNGAHNFSSMQGLAAAGTGGLYSFVGSDFSATLAALAQSGKLEVLSRPSVLARNNQQATITIGQQVPLITGVNYDTFGNQRNAITYQNVGIILQVTPFITSDGMVEMIVAPQISSVSDSTVNISGGSNAVAAPLINIRSADTVVVTPDNQTIIIGGLMSTKKTDSTSKIPILGDIPLLGAAFRRKVKNDEKTELMIFLTPTIVRDPRELAMMTSAERAKSENAPKAFPKGELDHYLDKPGTIEAPSESNPPNKK